MPLERSAGAIIYRKEGGKTYYLLLHYSTGPRTPKDYWDLPKGHIEKGEKLVDTARRETVEETGLVDIKFIDGFKETIKYFFKHEGKTILKFVTFYLAETETKEIKISYEHAGFKWLPYKEAFEQATFKNAKEILKKANEFLSKKSL